MYEYAKWCFNQYASVNMQIYDKGHVWKPYLLWKRYFGNIVVVPKTNVGRKSIIQVTKSRMRWAGHVACMGEKRGASRILVGRLDGRRPLGRPGVDGRIILKWGSQKVV
jgi:hypothetical protein